MAAVKGEPRAMLIYGTALFNGDGMPRDPLLGYLFVTRAAETGFEPARMTLQRLDEILSREDREQALQLSLPSTDGESPLDSSQAKKVRKPVRMATPSGPPRPEQAPRIQKPAAAAKGAWRIQLGAFSKRSAAETLFGSLSAKNALKGRQAFYIPVGPITRLQVGPFNSQGAAQSACNALKPQPCFPVRAN